MVQLGMKVDTPIAIGKSAKIAIDSTRNMVVAEAAITDA
jgi:hypothetical protein